MGELPNEWIDLAQRERGRRLAFEIAADEAVLGDAEFQRCNTSFLDDGGAVLLDEGEDAEDPPDAELPVATVNAVAQRADVVPGPSRAGEECHCRRWGPGGPVIGVDRMTASRLAAVLP